jgi:hypothetical protein
VNRRARSTEKAEASTGSRRWTPGARLRPRRQIEDQWSAALAYAGTVADLGQASHQYTAGQAATLAWLLGRAAEPLTFRAADGRPGPAQVAELERYARRLATGVPGEEVSSSRPYAVGVEYVCRWARRVDVALPIPKPDRPEQGRAG